MAKRLVTALCSVAFIVGLCGCTSSGSTNSASAVSSQEATSESTIAFELDKEVSFDGVTALIDSRWKETTAPKEYEVKYSVMTDDGNFAISTIEIRGYLNGETASVDTFKDVWGYQTDYAIIDEWDVGTNKMTIFAGDNKNGNWASYLIGYSPDNKGFSIFFSLGEYGVKDKGYINDSNKRQILDFYKQVKWEPSRTVFDSFDLYQANKADVASRDESSSENTSTTANEGMASATISQANALKMAKQYLDYTAFSYSGLIEQLVYEKFSREDAVYAADNCGANWNIQAEKKAEEYMDYSAFSREGLIDQLEYEGFTPEQAEYGAASVGL